MTDNELFVLLKNRFGMARKANNGWIRVKCPTCNPHDAIKLKRGINLKTLQTHCFICLRPLSLYEMFGNVDIQRIPRNPEAIEEEIPEHPQAREWPCSAIVPVSALPKSHPAIKFLHKDFLFDLTRYYTEYDIGYILAEDAKEIRFDRDDGTATIIKPCDSLIFPTYFKGEFVGWQCRFIPGTPFGDRMGKLKYLHIFQKGKYLYNYDKAKEYESIVVVEGVKKALKFPNGVCTWGKGITDKQIQLIQEWKKVILMYDAGEKTQAKAQEVCDAIKLNGVKAINIDPGKYGFESPDEMQESTAQQIAYLEWKNSGY